MIALADQSDVTNAAHLWAGIGITVALAFVTYVALELRAARRPAAPYVPDEKPRPCHTTGCWYPATAMVVRQGAHPQVEVLDVCEGCADEGTAHGWWFRLRVGLEF